MNFAAAFNLDVGPVGLSVPVQLAIPVSADIPAGSTVYFYRAGQFLNADLTTSPIWWQVETGTVDGNHVAHTHSPPEPGVANSGLYLVGNNPSTLDQFDVDLQANQIIGAPSRESGLAVAVRGANNSLTGAMGIVSSVGINATLALPDKLGPTPILISILRQNAPPFISTYNVQLVPGKVNKFTTSITVPVTPPTPAPVITAVAIADIKEDQSSPQILLTGSKFLTAPNNQTVDYSKLQVSFRQANGTTFTAAPIAGGSDTSLTVPVPEGAVLGISQITVLRPDPIITIDSTSPNGYTRHERPIQCQQSGADQPVE